MIYDLKINSKEAKEKFNDYISRGIVIELNNLTKRSIHQNSYLHVVITYFAMELGYTLKESKIFLKKECPFIDDEVKTSEMNTKEIQKHKCIIDAMDREDMARLWRFAKSGHPYFVNDSELYKHFVKCFKELGGMSPEISKRIGWEE